MHRKLAISSILVAAWIGAVAASTQAANSRPAVGDWSGSFKVKPASALTFMVTGSGHKRVVSEFLSSRSIKAPCPDAIPPTISGLPDAAVTAAGTFRARGTESNGFGAQSWTVSGKFKGGHATGAVAIDLVPAPGKKCDYAVKWSAALNAAAHPKPGATYKGKETISTAAVKFAISASGKEITTISWAQPLIGGSCPAVSSNQVILTAKNVPIHGSKFSYTDRSGKLSQGSGTVNINTITGEFLAGGQAEGTVATSADITGFGTTCKGNDTWTAKG